MNLTIEVRAEDIREAITKAITRGPSIMGQNPLMLAIGKAMQENEARLEAWAREQVATVMADQQFRADIRREIKHAMLAEAQAMAVEILRMRRDCPPTAEVEAMRRALVRCGRAVGGKMADDVSVEFLGYIPAEVERVVERLRDEVTQLEGMERQRDAETARADAAEKEVERLRAELAAKQTAEAEAAQQGPSDKFHAAMRQAHQSSELNARNTEARLHMLWVAVDEMARAVWRAGVKL